MLGCVSNNPAFFMPPFLSLKGVTINKLAVALLAVFNSLWSLSNFLKAEIKPCGFLVISAAVASA